MNEMENLHLKEGSATTRLELFLNHHSAAATARTHGVVMCGGPASLVALCCDYMCLYSMELGSVPDHS